MAPEFSPKLLSASGGTRKRVRIATLEMKSQDYPLLLKKLPISPEDSRNAALESLALCREVRALICVSRDLIAGSRRFIDENKRALADADMILETCLLECWGKESHSSDKG
jgi:hypothetical protein